MANATNAQTNEDGPNKTASKLLFALLSSNASETNSATTTPFAVYDDPDFIPTMNLDTDRYHFLEKFLNQSKLISDVPPYMGYWNTPLTVPEPELMFRSNSTYYDDGHLVGSSNTKELAWLIPAVISAIFIFFMIAYACFYGVRALELKVTNCCLRVCGCCFPRGRAGSGDERAALTSSMAQHATEMKAYQSHSAQGGGLNMDLL